MGVFKDRRAARFGPVTGTTFTSTGTGVSDFASGGVKLPSQVSALATADIGAVAGRIKIGINGGSAEIGVYIGGTAFVFRSNTQSA